MLVTERPGRMRIVAHERPALAASRERAESYAQSQAGLLDVILDRNFTQNNTYIFLTPSRPTAAAASQCRAPGLIAGEDPRLDDVNP